MRLLNCLSIFLLLVSANYSVAGQEPEEIPGFNSDTPTINSPSEHMISEDNAQSRQANNSNNRSRNKIENDLRGESGNLDDKYTSRIGEFNLLDAGKLAAEKKREKERVELLKLIRERMQLENELQGPSASVSNAGNYGVKGLHVLKIWGKSEDYSALVYLNGRYITVREGDRLNSNIQVAKIDSSSSIFYIGDKSIKLGLSSNAAFKSEEQNTGDNGQPRQGIAIPLGPGSYTK